MVTRRHREFVSTKAVPDDESEEVMTEKTRKEWRLMPSLPPWEISVNTASWVILISCATYSAVSHLSDYIEHFYEYSDSEWEALAQSGGKFTRENVLENVLEIPYTRKMVENE